jgi:hypothetical protein
MFSFNNKTYFFTSKEMLKIDNSKEFICSLISNIIETITTNHPTMIKLLNENNYFYIVIGYSDIFIVSFDENNKEYVNSLEIELLEFAQEIILETEKFLLNHKTTSEDYKCINSLLKELIDTTSSVANICNCYDIRKKTIDDILYSYENNHSYAIIYDQLDDLTETYRIVTEDITYLIYVNPIVIDIDIINIGRNQFSEILYNELKTTNNLHIKKCSKKINKYIKKSTI